MSKVRKVFRYWRARVQPPSALPFFWHVGRPNFGDDINPSFFHATVNSRVRLQTRRDRPHFLGMGSILDRATAESTVLGSGCLVPPVKGSIKPGQVFAVRGELSLEGLSSAEGVLLGDPMVILNLIFPLRAHRDGPVGLVPHVSEVSRFQRLKIPGVKVIHPGNNPWRVIKDIASCSRILSQSLHGLIVADALEIPNAWLTPSSNMAGDGFKFHDYFSTLDADKEPHPFDLETVIHLPAHLFHVSHYKYDKRTLLEVIQHATSRSNA